jgi:hypothetical protein
VTTETKSKGIRFLTNNIPGSIRVIRVAQNDAAGVLILYGQPPRIHVPGNPQKLQWKLVPGNRTSLEDAVKDAAAGWTGKSTTRARIRQVLSGPEIASALAEARAENITTVVFVMETYMDAYSKKAYLLPARGTAISGVSADELVRALPPSVTEVYFEACMGVLLKSQAERAEENTDFRRKYHGSDHFMDLRVVPDATRVDSQVKRVEVVDQER